MARGDRVALWADRTPAVVAAALAAMDVGAAYVPIDPTYPSERVARMLRAARPAVLLYDEASEPPPSVVDLDAVGIGSLARPVRERRKPSPPTAGDAAYVVFTSGSSGQPKGVVVEHRSLVNYVCWCAQTIGCLRGGAPLFASLGFDHAVTCLWVPLACGHPVVLVPGLWDAEAIFAARRPRYAFLKITPSHVRFFERLIKPDYAGATRLAMFGGEALHAELVRSLEERLAGIRLMNHYGPTEATVGCCAHELTVEDVPDEGTIPIGTPIWNSRAYVVDDQLRPVADDEEGELVIAGACVARGYLDGDDDDRFVPERLVAGRTAGGDGCAYRTGDVVRRLPAGPLIHVRRDDGQLKVGGHRVELEEMRRHALSVGGVAEVAFDVRRDALDEVRAFVVPDGAHADRSELAAAVQGRLACVLPTALVPRTVHVVPELVFNAHGKCDLVATRALHQREAP